MKRAISILLVTLILFVSCEETTGKGNLRIILQTDSQTKTISPDERSTSIVKYNVQGVGPDGKTFSKDSSSKSITIDGIPMGTWSVSATGYNSDSVKIVSGTKTFSFNNSASSVYINMSSYAGTGSLQIALSWDSSVTSPIIKTYLSKDSETIEDSITLKADASSYTYSKTNLESGTYLLIIKLYNNDSFVTGFTESIQIANNKTTSGSISLKDSSGSTSESNTGSVLSGYFTVDGSSELPTTFESNTSILFSFIFDDKTLDTDNLIYCWYLDGTLVSTKKSLTTTPSIGEHTINLVVTDSVVTESFFYKFTVQTNAKKGSATLVSEVPVSTNKLALAPDSIISLLPSGHFLLVTPSRSSMQVFTIYNNTISITSGSTYNATDLRFTWLPQVSKVYSNQNMNFLILQTEQNCIHVLYFNQKTGQIELALWNEEPLCLTGFVEFPPAFIDNVTSVSLVPTSNYAGMIFIFDSGDRSEDLLGIETSETSIKSLGTSILSNDMDSFITSDGNGSVLGTILSNSELRFANIQNCTTSSTWYSHADNSLKDIKYFKFLNSQYAIFSNYKSFKIYEFYPKQKVWVSRTSLEIEFNSICVSSDGAYLYLADKEGNLLTYRSGLSDNFGKIYTQNMSNSLSQITTNDQSLLGLDKTGNLYIFKVIQEDTST